MNKNIELEYLKIKNDSSRAIFMIHGYGASMHDLYGLAAYLDPGKQFDWYFPNGNQIINLGFHMQGRSWFPVDMEAVQQAMVRGEFRNFKDTNPPGMDMALAILREFISDKIDAYDEIIIGGFSQGAMLASHLATLIPSVKAALFFSGVLVAQSELLPLLDNARALPFFQSHGKQDPILNFSEAAELYELLKLYRWKGEFVSFEGGHEIPMPILQKAQLFLKEILK